LGINVLRNDGMAALAVAAATGGAFVRVNVLCGACVTDQGIINGIAHELLRERKLLGSDIKILADVNVKHSAPLATRPIEDEVADLTQRGGADAVIVSGRSTGLPVDLAELAAVRAASGDTPVLVGSGVTAASIEMYQAQADGFIVGTALKKDGVVSNPVDERRVQALIQRLGR